MNQTEDRLDNILDSLKNWYAPDYDALSHHLARAIVIHNSLKRKPMIEERLDELDTYVRERAVDKKFKRQASEQIFRYRMQHKYGNRLDGKTWRLILCADNETLFREWSQYTLFNRVALPIKRMYGSLRERWLYRRAVRRFRNTEYYRPPS